MRMFAAWAVSTAHKAKDANSSMSPSGLPRPWGLYRFTFKTIARDASLQNPEEPSKSDGATSAHLRHVVSQGLELHGHAHEIHLVDGGHIGLEGPARAGLQALAAQQTVETRPALAHHVGETLVVRRREEQHLLADVVVHVVEVALVAQVGVEVVHLAVELPVGIPVFGEGHARVHHPGQRHHRRVGKLADAVGQVTLGHLGPQVLDVGRLGEMLVNAPEREQVLAQVFVKQGLEGRYVMIVVHLQCVCKNSIRIDWLLAKVTIIGELQQEKCKSLVTLSK